MKSASLVAIALSISSSHAFQASRVGHVTTATLTVHSAPLPAEIDTPITKNESYLWKNSSITAATAAAAALFLATAPANAVSGGGLDYAGLDISNQDYSNGNYKGKDFTQVLAKATTFANSNLQGCRFYKAYLVSYSS